MTRWAVRPPSSRCRVCLNAGQQRVVARASPAALRDQVPGVLGFFTAKDVPGDNHIGPVVPDEEVYASELVTSVGQVGGAP